MIFKLFVSIIAIAFIGILLFGFIIYLRRPNYGTMKEAYHPFRSLDARDRFLKYYDNRAKLWPVDSETKMIQTSYGKTFVRISGPKDAQALVLLHGDTENSNSWLPQIETFSEKYRTYAIDNIFDNGRSIYSAPLKSPDDFVNWLDELFNELNLEDNINLVGFSYGGWVTSIYAHSYPNRLNKLILITPSGTVLSPRIEYLIRGMLTYFIPNRFFCESLVNWERAGLLEKGDTGRVVIDQMVEELLLAKQCFKQRGFVAPTVLSDEDWQNLKMPILFLVGEKEVLYSSQKAVQRLNMVVPQVQTEFVPNARHDITHSQAELINKKIMDFLQSQ